MATFRTKILIFSAVIHFNCLAKIELRGARGPCMVVNIVVNYRCKRKMQKETKTEKLHFLSYFVIGNISIE